MGERPFNAYPIALDALNARERRQVIDMVAWLNVHCVAVEAKRISRTIVMSTYKAAGAPILPAGCGCEDKGLLPPSYMPWMGALAK